MSADLQDGAARIIKAYLNIADHAEVRKELLPLAVEDVASTLYEQVPADTIRGYVKGWEWLADLVVYSTEIPEKGQIIDWYRELIRPGGIYHG